MRDVYMLSGILAIVNLVILWTATRGTNQVATSNGNTCVLSGTNVYCWGRGTGGILGTGNTTDLYVPPTTPIDLGNDFVTQEIDCGDRHCCGVSSNKTLKCWGYNPHGQLGQEDINNRGDEADEMGDHLNIVDLGSEFDVQHVSCGRFHTCAIATNHTIKCFGYNAHGQLGYGHADNIGDADGEMGDDLQVVNLGDDFVPVDVRAGYDHSCAISMNSQVKCWGYNSYGQLGQGDTTNRGDDINQMGENLQAIDLGTDFNVSSIHCGGYHVCALSNISDMKCWGRNLQSQLGLGDNQNRGDDVGEMGEALSVVDLGTDFIPQLVGGGMYHNIAISMNGSLKAWGRNGYGQLGYGDANNRGDSDDEIGDYLPLIDIGTDYNVTSIASDSTSEHSCVLFENGTDFLGLKCWGLNQYGQLGLNDTENRGDEANEMGSNLSFVSVSLTPTESPTTNPTTTTQTGWIMHNNTVLPRADRDMALGYYNNSIHIFGGLNYPYQWTKYDMLKDEMIDFGEDYLNDTLGNEDGERGYSTTHFTQINDTTVYIINGNGTSINVYNLETLSYQDLNTIIPISLWIKNRCLASSETPSPRLFIPGGGSNMTNLQVLSLADMQWVSSPPSMIANRSRHGCIVANDKLWAIAGRLGRTVEVINTTNIANETWLEIGNVSCNLVTVGVTVVDLTIFVVGGFCSGLDHGLRSDTVYTIDAVTNDISIYAYSLPYAENGMPLVAIDATIYGFGGQTCGSCLENTWLTLDMLSITFVPFYRWQSILPKLSDSEYVVWLNRPTIAPTVNPTSNPTPEPTSEPTQPPTSNPTPQATSEPSQPPTSNPLCHGASYEGSMECVDDICDALWGGESMVSPNCQYTLIMEQSGNLTLYKISSQHIWSTNTTVSSGQPQLTLFQNEYSAGFVVLEMPVNGTNDDPMTLWNVVRSSSGDNLTLSLFDNGTLILYDSERSLWTLITAESSKQADGPTSEPTISPTTNSATEMETGSDSLSAFLVGIIAVCIVAMFVVFFLRRRRKVQAQMENDAATILEMNVNEQQGQQLEHATRDEEGLEGQQEHPRDSVVVSMRSEGMEIRPRHDTAGMDAGNV